MAINIGGLIVEIRPAFEAASDVVHDRTIPMANAIVILIPRRDLIVRQETVIVFAAHLILSRRSRTFARFRHAQLLGIMRVLLTVTGVSELIYLPRTDAGEDAGRECSIECSSAAVWENINSSALRKHSPKYLTDFGTCKPASCCVADMLLLWLHDNL